MNDSPFDSCGEDDAEVADLQRRLSTLRCVLRPLDLDRAAPDALFAAASITPPARKFPRFSRLSIAACLAPLCVAACVWLVLRPQVEPRTDSGALQSAAGFTRELDEHHHASLSNRATEIPAHPPSIIDSTRLAAPGGARTKRTPPRHTPRRYEAQALAAARLPVKLHSATLSRAASTNATPHRHAARLLLALQITGDNLNRTRRSLTSRLPSNTAAAAPPQDAS